MSIRAMKFRYRAWLAVSLFWVFLALPGSAHCAPSAHWVLFSDGDGVLAVLDLDPGEGHYVYGPEPQFTGLPTRLSLTGSGPNSIDPQVFYPPPQEKIDKASGKTVLVYQGPTPIFVRLSSVPKPLVLEGAVSMLLCTDTTCMPKTLPVKGEWPDLDPASLPTADGQPWWLLYQVSAQAGEGAAPGAALPSVVAPVPSGKTQSRTGEWDFEPVFFAADLEVAGLGKAILFGLLAGLILNFMPCVLPVVGLKVSTLLSAAEQGTQRERVARFREHNVFFSIGILLYFLILAGLFASAGIAWGELFQKPSVVFGLAVVVFLLGLSLFGVMNLPVVDLKGGGDGAGRVSALFTGLLATLLATPCSGPLLGGVLGWTLWQPPHVVAVVFTAVGAGMASPYLLMAARPGLARFYPKPGAWVGYMEKSVAFFLMATCLYLVSILPSPMIVPAFVTLFACAFAAWMWGGWTGLHHGLARRFAIRLSAVLLVVLVGWLALTPGEEAGWEPFDQTAFSSMLGKERILMDFTADWCPNCKVLEQVVLTPDRLLQWQEQYDLRLIQVDMTAMDPEQSRLLKSLGSASIPVVAIFQKGDDSRRPIVLRDLFTGEQIEGALQRAFD